MVNIIIVCLLCLIKVEEFKGATIKPGLYYVETDNYMPMRSNGWYYHNMICYCLENDIIKFDNIKYVIKSSLSLPKNFIINSLISVTTILKIIVNLLLIQ